MIGLTVILGRVSRGSGRTRHGSSIFLAVTEQLYTSLCLSVCLSGGGFRALTALKLFDFIQVRCASTQGQ